LRDTEDVEAGGDHALLPQNPKRAHPALRLLELPEPDGPNDAGNLAHDEVLTRELFLVQTLLDFCIRLQAGVLVVVDAAVGEVVTEVVDGLEDGRHDQHHDRDDALEAELLVLCHHQARQPVQEKAPGRGRFDGGLARDLGTQNAYKNHRDRDEKEGTAHDLRAHLPREEVYCVGLVEHHRHLEEGLARYAHAYFQTQQRNREPVEFGAFAGCVLGLSIEILLRVSVEGKEKDGDGDHADEEEDLVDGLESDDLAHHGAEHGTQEHA